MNKKFQLLALLLLTFTCAYCRAEHNGIELSEECSIAANSDNPNLNDSPGDALKRGICIGLVRGVMESMMLWDAADKRRTQQAFHGCIIDAVMPLEAIKVVVKFLNDNPSRLHEPDTVLINVALSQAYPCRATLAEPSR